MIATTGQKASFGLLTTHDPIALIGAGGAAAVAGASPIPHPMTCPARMTYPRAMVIVPPRDTVRARGTVPVPSAGQARTTALAQITVVAKPGPSAISAPSTPLA